VRLDLIRRTGGLEIIKLVSTRIPNTFIVLTSYGSAGREVMADRADAHAFLRKSKPQVAQVIHGLIESPRTEVVQTN
jgi:hypothetical protein